MIFVDKSARVFDAPERIEYLEGMRRFESCSVGMLSPGLSVRFVHADSFIRAVEDTYGRQDISFAKTTAVVRAPHGPPMPKRSRTMPKREEKDVLARGICSCPPSARAENERSASALLATVSDSEKPWKFGLPRQGPSAAPRTRRSA